MKQIVPEVYVKRCGEALLFYAAVFGGSVKNLCMSDDLERFKGLRGKVIHAELHVNRRCVFYFLDALGKERAASGNVTLMLHMDSLAEARRVSEALSEGGTVTMPLVKTESGAHHAMVTDRYGAAWSIRYTPRTQG